MDNTLANFDYARFYHVFNRTNNSETLFHTDENKRYFLELVFKRLNGYVKFYAYALLGNHFHFAISICSEESIARYIRSITESERSKTEAEFLSASDDSRDVHKLISKQWSRVFNSYTQAINKRYNRKGHLFHSPFKRSVIKDETKFSYLLYYIHHNSRHHGIVNNFLQDPWHSYHELEGISETWLQRKYVLDWFGGKEKFIDFHSANHLESIF